MGLPSLAALLLATPTHAFQEDVARTDLALARTAFAELRERVRADGGELWGLELDFPVLLVDPGSRAAFADRADREGLLVEHDGVWTGRYPDERAVANFMTDWAGHRWTMVVWPPPADPGARTRLLLHESFHNAQAALGLAQLAGPCEHLASHDGRLWLRLEANAWAAALRAEAGSAERDEAVTDALVLRARRGALFPGAAEAEDALERHEGAAEYTGVRLFSDDPAARVAVALRALDGLHRRPSLARAFQYDTGPALGLLMDDYDPLWREDFLAGRALSALLAAAVGFEVPGELAEEAEFRAVAYDLERIAAEEAAREEQRLARVAEYRARFLDGPVLVLPALAPRNSFDPGRIEPLDDVGSVYGTYWVSDEWGVANAPGGALVMNDGSVRLAAPTDVEGPELAGEGWTLELAPGWHTAPGSRAAELVLAR